MYIYIHISGTPNWMLLRVDLIEYDYKLLLTFIILKHHKLLI